MQATTCFHDGVPNPVFQEADFVFHDPIAFYPANSMFDPDADGRDPTIGRFFRRSELPATRGFLGLEDRDPMQEESLEALILIQTTAGWQRIALQLCNALIRGFPFIGVAQKENVTGLINHEEVLERVTLLLATIILFLILGIFWALDWSFGPVLHKRGGDEGLSDWCVVSIAAKSPAVRAGSSPWSARA